LNESKEGMKQWDILMFPFSRERRHPAVILSKTMKRVSTKLTEEILDEADGLDWKTIVRCDKIYLLPKAHFDDHKGSVTEERRHLIARKIVEILRLPIHRR
jgi:hypothetical protein